MCDVGGNSVKALKHLGISEKSVLSSAVWTVEVA